MNFTKLRVAVKNRVGIVTINRPPVNALDRATISELDECFDGFLTDSEIKAAVLTGEGPCFAAGTDLTQLKEAFGDPKKAEAFSIAGQRLLNKIEAFRKPVIAAVNGACLGGGLELAMSCHMRMAAEEAKLGMPEIKLGIIPGYGGTQRLARLTNPAKALELIVTGEPIDGKEARRIGLVNACSPAAEVIGRAVKLAERIAQRSSTSVERAKEAVWAGTVMASHDGLALESGLFGELFATEDAREGIEAFLAKRKPEFRDR